MVESVEIKSKETGAEAPKEENKPEEQFKLKSEERPDWLPEKFKSAEDMAKAYGELESKLGSQDKTYENETKLSNKEEQPTDKKEGDLSIDKNAQEAVDKAGLNLETLQQEYSKEGQLADKSYEALEKAGIPKDYVDAFIKGQEAIATQTANTLKQEVGGNESYKAMMDWAVDNLTETEITAYNNTVNGKDIEATRLAISGLNARFQNATGNAPNLQSANKATAANAPGYRSWAEVTAAMSDDRYQKDSAYRADVQNKIKNSRL